MRDFQFRGNFNHEQNGIFSNDIVRSIMNYVSDVTMLHISADMNFE